MKVTPGFITIELGGSDQVVSPAGVRCDDHNGVGLREDLVELVGGERTDRHRGLAARSGPPVRPTAMTRISNALATRIIWLPIRPTPMMTIVFPASSSAVKRCQMCSRCRSAIQLLPASGEQRKEDKLAQCAAMDTAGGGDDHIRVDQIRVAGQVDPYRLRFPAAISGLAKVSEGRFWPHAATQKSTSAERRMSSHSACFSGDACEVGRDRRDRRRTWREAASRAGRRSRLDRGRRRACGQPVFGSNGEAMTTLMRS